jgi:hypothetical protein
MSWKLNRNRDDNERDYREARRKSEKVAPFALHGVIEQKRQQ